MRRSKPKGRTLKWPFGPTVVFGLVALCVAYQMCSLSRFALYSISTFSSTILMGSHGGTTPEKPTPGIANHEAWCPSVICDAQYNDDDARNRNIAAEVDTTCQPCHRRFLFIISSARSGSTSLMDMIGKLPHVRVAGENNNALLAVKRLIDKFKSIRRRAKETNGAWKHHAVTDESLTCLAQTAMGTINPPLSANGNADSDLTIDDIVTTDDTILAFKTIRFVGDSWKRKDDEDTWASVEEAVQFVQDHFPCSRVIVNIQSDVSRQIESRKSLKGFRDVTTKVLEEDIRDLKKVHAQFGKQAFLLDANEWAGSEDGIDKINEMVKWLGFKDCTFKRLIHDNAGAFNVDKEPLDLGPNCRFSRDSHYDQMVLPSINDSSNEQRVIPSNDDSSDNTTDEPVVEIKLAICAWVQDEAPSLSEWIEHHVAIGFDLIILHNDNSDDDTQCVMDAYADKGLVLKMSEVNKEYVDGVDINHQGRRPMLFNVGSMSVYSITQLSPGITFSSVAFVFIGVVYDICRKHLLDLERQTEGKGTKWWMLTNDPDEFLWINRSTGATTAKDVLQHLLSNQPTLLSIRIPNFTYGSSGREEYSPESAMKSFNYRFDDKAYMENPNREIIFKGLIEPYQVQQKAFSMVSEMAEDCGEKIKYCSITHYHSISTDVVKDKLNKSNAKDTKFRFQVMDKVKEYFSLAHYKVKSREEFYERVCHSGYFGKYYHPGSIRKEGYPGCCSPKAFFDSLNHYATLFDDRMSEFSFRLTNTSAHCNVKLQKSVCPKHLMEITGKEGIRAMKNWRSNLEIWEDASDFAPSNQDSTPGEMSILRKTDEDRPLIFAAGFGNTGTHSIFRGTCAIGLCSVHWDLECCEKSILTYPEYYTAVTSQQIVPFAGFLAHRRTSKAFKVLNDCLLQDEHPCPSVRVAFHSLRRHIDNVLSKKDIDVIHDTPYLEFTEYVLKSAEKTRGTKPIVLMSERDPEEWAVRRVDTNHASFFCTPELTLEDGISPIGSNLYLCLKTAIAKGLGDSSIRDILLHPQSEELYLHGQKGLSIGLRKYQERMRNVAVYRVNLFEHKPPLEKSEIETLIKQALAPHGVNETELPKKIVRHAKTTQPQRTCMPDYETAIYTGRHCDKLVIFLHFRKGGGTSMIDYFHNRGLITDFRVNQDPLVFDEFQDGDDMSLAKWKNNLRLRNNNGTVMKTRASKTEFWWSLYQRGLDVVNLEYNFLLPKDYFHTKSAFYSLTMIRKPWDRYRSTYEERLYQMCRRGNVTLSCYEEHDLGQWITSHTGSMVKFKKIWGGDLLPNYYTRMLNGLNDSPDIELNQVHLETAKRVLESFDNVLVLETADESKLKKLRTFLGGHEDDAKHAVEFPKQSNNFLKDSPIYGALRERIDRFQTLFDEQNALDNELYEWAKTRYS